jgi:hypothetical protein
MSGCWERGCKEQELEIGILFVTSTEIETPVVDALRKINLLQSEYRDYLLS